MNLQEGETKENSKSEMSFRKLDGNSCHNCKYVDHLEKKCTRPYEKQLHFEIVYTRDYICNGHELIKEVQYAII